MGAAWTQFGVDRTGAREYGSKNWRKKGHIINGLVITKNNRGKCDEKNNPEKENDRPRTKFSEKGRHYPGSQWGRLGIKTAASPQNWSE